MEKAMKSKKKVTASDWQNRAETRLFQIIKVARTFPGLARLGPSQPWKVEVHLVGSQAMTRLNSEYRGKSYPTDVLSFPAFDPFREAGLLGELVICLPTLKSQAKTLEHSSERELDILITHGLLHLLGLDHEKNTREANRMARWESKILKLLSPRAFRELRGLIDRSDSGI